jgi:hypothetical protein
MANRIAAMNELEDRHRRALSHCLLRRGKVAGLTQAALAAEKYG